MSESVPEPKLQVGGTLTPHKHLYISRKVEEDRLFDLLNSREYCNVVASRQVGKSSVVSYITERLEKAGNCVAYVDISGEIGRAADAVGWYQGLMELIVLECGIEIEVTEWWEKQPKATPNQQLMRFFRDVLLTEIQAPVIIFIDEIDFSLDLPYTDDFFVAIRTMYNTRNRQPLFERLTFCLVGVATPNELIKKRRTTPYNIGQVLELSDFEWDPENLRQLIHYLSPDQTRGEALLEQVFQWTAGHPFLTLWICEEIVKGKLEEPEKVDSLATDMFENLAKVSSHPHFERITTFFDNRISDKLDAYTTYEKILQNKQVLDQATQTHIKLKLAGLVKRNPKGHLEVRNRIYRRVFNLDWVGKSKPKLTLRNLKRFAMAAGFLIVSFFAYFSYNFLVLEPLTQMAAELETQISQTSDIEEAETLYQYLAGEKPYPKIEHNPLLGPSLSGFEERAQLAIDSFWSRTEEQAVEKWLVALRNTSKEDDAKRYFEISNGQQEDPDLKRILKGHQEEALAAIRSFWKKRADELEQRALARLQTDEDGTAGVRDVDEGILLGMLAALKRNGPPHVTVLEAYQSRSYHGLVMTIRMSFQAFNGRRVVYSPNGERIVVTSDVSGLIIAETLTGKIVTRVKDLKEPTGLAFWPNGKRLAVGTGSKTAILDIPSGKISVVAKELENAWEVAVSPQGSHLANTNRYQIFIRGTAKGQIIQTMAMQSIIYAVVFSPNGKNLLSTDGKGGVIIWDVESGEKKVSFEGHSDLVGHGQFSPDGQLIVTSSDDTTARVWEASSGKQLKVFELNTQVNDATFSRDNRYALISTEGNFNEVSFWDVRTGKRVVNINAHKGSVLNVAYSPTGDTFATRSADNTLCVWNATDLSSEYFSKAPSGTPQELWKAIQQKLNLSVDENDEVRPLWPEGFSAQEGWTGDPIEVAD